MCFKNLIEIYKKELSKKIDNKENYFANEASFIKKCYYDYFDKDFNTVFRYLKELSKTSFKNDIIDCHNSEILFISLCEKYFPEIQ